MDRDRDEKVVAARTIQYRWRRRRLERETVKADTLTALCFWRERGLLSKRKLYLGRIETQIHRIQRQLKRPCDVLIHVDFLRREVRCAPGTFDAMIEDMWPADPLRGELERRACLRAALS